MRPSAAILDGEMEHRNGEIEHHMEHQNGEMGHQNKEMEHQNGEMDWFEYTPGCKRLIQPPVCNSTTTRIVMKLGFRILPQFVFCNFVYSPGFFPDRARTDSANIARNDDFGAQGLRRPSGGIG